MKWIFAAGVAALLLAATASAALARGGAFSRISTRSKTTTVNTPGATESATAKCPRGKRRVSGGFATNLEPGEGPIVKRSTAVHRRAWKTVANVMQVIGEDYNVTSVVDCAKRAPRTKAHEDTTMVPFNGAGGATAVCPRGTRAIAGGFATSFDAGMGTGNIVYSSHRVRQRKWRTEAVGSDAESSPPTPLTSIAYCGHAPRLTTSSDTGEVGTSTPTATVAPTCPRGKRAVSGGFETTAQSFDEGFTASRPAKSRLTGPRTWKVTEVYPNFDGPYEFTAFAYCAPT